MDIQSLAALSNSELLARAARLAHGERRATAALVAHLAEIETRKLYLGEACSSLFTYCVRVLHLSEPAAYNRIQAARAARRFPAVLVHLEEGRVHLAAVKLLAPVMTMENHHELLAAAAHKSKREVEELVARQRPQPDVPAQIRKLPVLQEAVATQGAQATEARQPIQAQAELLDSTGSHRAAVVPSVAGAGVTPRCAAVPSAEVVPLAPERYKVQFTAGAATREKLRRAQELLRHRIPDGNVAAVIDLALDLLVQQLEKAKFAATQRPRHGNHGTEEPSKSLPLVASTSSSASSASRYIPADVRRTVWARDGAQCAFVSAAGARCTERARLEFDHVQPRADGGGADVHNLRLLCRQHNQYEARQFFGLWHADGVGEFAG
jgi:5-methylcytosine-specific restriction endonuclease McrA